ncbi:hypothetical protein ElyMa_005080400 [Elysia marginata]|uniref:Uncharacterized protein n=1 Tax=Elysia marginata TaxID=1093978 RepID=A0AAV4JI00_9GAST|nr:hypothetical protein ElyMa_005080400 [Elysia marginata]
MYFVRLQATLKDPRMISRRTSLLSTGTAFIFLLVAQVVGVTGQQRATNVKDQVLEIGIDSQIITFDEDTLTRFYSLICRNWASKFTQPITESSNDPAVFEADSSPASIRTKHRTSTDVVNNLLCSVDFREEKMISCTRRKDAVHSCRRRRSRDCHEFHLSWNDNLSKSEDCDGKCVNIAWIWARHSVTFTYSPQLRSKLAVISEGLCPNNPRKKSKTTLTPPSTTGNSTAAVGGDEERESEVIVALCVIGGILLLVLIAAAILCVVCCRRRRDAKHEKNSVAVQTNRRPIRRWNIIQRPAFLSRNRYRNPRDDLPPPVIPAEDGSNSSPIYYEISSVEYEEPIHVRREEEERAETHRDKGSDYDYRQLRATRSEALEDRNDVTVMKTYGQDSASAERPPDLVPAGELVRGCPPVVVSVSDAPVSPPLPKPRSRTGQSTFKIRN